MTPVAPTLNKDRDWPADTDAERDFYRINLLYKGFQLST
jgi:hypothetical protein